MEFSFPKIASLPLFILVLILAGSRVAVGQSESVVYSFQGTADGDIPMAGLISDAAGNFYGTTNGIGDPCHSDCGTAFELTPATGGGWNEMVLHNFIGGGDGRSPVGGLIFDQAGNLYGTTEFGGSGFDEGTVFELSLQDGVWTETILYKFKGGADGAQPTAGLVFDNAGNLYGTTLAGGQPQFGYRDNGTVFQLKPSQGGTWTETVIHTFGVGKDGFQPYAGLTIDQAGNLYGTTLAGGGGSCQYFGTPGCGAVFELEPPAKRGGAWTEKVLYRFKGGTSDGQAPDAALIFDPKGNLDGVTQDGGICSVSGFCGTVFQLTPGAAGAWTESVLYSFTGGSDGGFPRGSLILDGAGDLYGTTEFGGTGGICRDNNSCGTVFELKPSKSGPWSETVLYNFTKGRDGYWPVAGLIRGKFDALFGTTVLGGKGMCKSGTKIIGCGTVFKIHP
jgi:uncharacterized repeat protein (TIGR03803 family)